VNEEMGEESEGMNKKAREENVCNRYRKGGRKEMKWQCFGSRTRDVTLTE
jgi:hypothetical protein